jgi:NAD-dependent SIR2 family protein deacetylase
MLEQNGTVQETKLKIKKYLELENVSILTGAGTSFHLGAPIIREIPESLGAECSYAIERYFPIDYKPSYEELMNCLQADRYIKQKKGNLTEDIDCTIKIMQQWLLNNCDTNKTVIPNIFSKNVNLQANRYHYHEAFLKKILQRPNNLKRANLFTTNYDMAFDYALDNLGVHYINGFMGVHNRYFRPEVYDYDLYYPGQSVSGKVFRAEKVIKYFKLHGSLSWISTNHCPQNTYGIKEVSLTPYNLLTQPRKAVEQLPPASPPFQMDMPPPPPPAQMGVPSSPSVHDEYNEILVYPSVNKKSFTLDLPYSELFRQFAQAIMQPQSVLFCLGYSFFDEHINDIINQALSIPSFTLIIANYSSPIDPNSPIEMLKRLNDKRIVVLDQTDVKMATFTGFVENVMPDLYEEEENEVIAETMGKLYQNRPSNSTLNNNEGLF